MTFARRVLLLILALVLIPAPARADPPGRLATQVTDDAGALGGRAEIDRALASLQRETGIQLFVVLVDSFDDTPAQQWTDQTAQLSDLGDRDALLAVATDDRTYAYSFPPYARITDDELEQVAAEDVEPALARGDWSGAVIAAATGYEQAAGGSSSYAWVLILLAAVIAGALLWVFLRRRRRAQPPPPPRAGPPTEDLTAQANALLLELDDDLRASQSELDLATAQYGDPETARFRAALEASRQDVAEAFRLRMSLDENPAPDEETRRRTLTEIIARCRAADDRLDAESEAFDRLRDLETRAPQVAAELETRLAALEAALPAATTTATELSRRWSGQTVTAVSGNVDQARERLQFTTSAIARARAALTTPPTPDGAAGPASGAGADPALGAGGTPDAAATPDAGPAQHAGPASGGVSGGRAEAALAVRAAEQAVQQAEQLVAAIHRAATDLEAARSAAGALIAELESEIATGRATLSSTSTSGSGSGTAAGGGPASGSPAGGGIAGGGMAAPPGLAEAVAGAERTVAEVRGHLAAEQPDPVVAVAALQAADAILDRALAEAQDAAQRLARARAQLTQALPVARAEVATASDFITTRRGAVGTGARASLSEAFRHLALAESLAESDPITALAEAQQAQRQAGAASSAAHSDVQSWAAYGSDGPGSYGPGGYGSGGYGPGDYGSGGYGRGGAGGFDAGAFAGAVLGGILSGGSRSHGHSGGRGGGWSGGGFGGSASRGRRTGGGGAGGGRRGGGGRF
ncbi:hypothetical protein Asp14428_34730 [Actinoplanes sp. NBRC 14428]|nr:hypothetical protein Asp14428_34730 [Actinoplanes sp. NBRC 14428]